MKAHLLVLVIFFSSVQSVFGQEKAYYNQTELGALFGKKTDTWDGQSENRVDFSILTFHGAKISKNQVIGISIGVDQYESITVFPVAFGWKGFLGKENKPRLIGGFDLGGGFALLEKKEKTEWYESRYHGGLLLSPSIGMKFPSKKGKKTSLTMSLAYKRQELEFFQGFFDFNSTPRPFTSSSLPPGYSSITETSYLFHSLAARMGFIF